MREIGIGQPNIAGLIRMAFDARLASQRRLDHGDQAIEPDPGAAAQVHRLHGPRSGAPGPLQPGENAVQRVGNIGVVALARSVAVHPDRPSPGDQIGELVNRQIRALARSVHREKPQADDAQRIQMREGMGQQLAGSLTRGVRRDRLDRRLRLGEGRRRRVTVD